MLLICTIMQCSVDIAARQRLLISDDSRWVFEKTDSKVFSDFV